MAIPAISGMAAPMVRIVPSLGMWWLPTGGNNTTIRGARKTAARQIVLPLLRGYSGMVLFSPASKSLPVTADVSIETRLTNFPPLVIQYSAEVGVTSTIRTSHLKFGYFDDRYIEIQASSVDPGLRRDDNYRRAPG